MASQAVQTSMQITGDDIAMQQLRALDRKVQNRVVRKATAAAGKEVLTEVKRTVAVFKVTGYTARSMKSTISARKGRVLVKIGQAKQKKFKLRTKRRSKGRNLSNIQRAGRPVPIHWLERGTKPHFITAPKGKRLYFQIKNRTRSSSGIISKRSVFSPGMRAKSLLRGSARRARGRAAAAWISEVRSGVKLNGT